MRIRTLGKTGIRVSEIGFGCWAIGGPAALGKTQIGWGRVDDGDSLRALQTAFDSGINFYDTADAYGGGHSEELVAEAFAKRRSQVVIATKGGNITDANGEWRKDFRGDFLVRRFEESLRRLRTDYIDLYQLHTPRTDDQLEQALSAAQALDRLIEQGKLRAYGISVAKPEDGLKQIEAGFGDSIQTHYNLLEREAERELFPRAVQTRVAIISRVPLAYGFLTGKFTKETRFGRDDHRSHTLSPEKIAEWVDKTDRLKPIAADLGISLAQLALQYILAQEAVSVAIPGAKTENQVRQNAVAGEAPPLSDEVINRIRRVVA